VPLGTSSLTFSVLLLSFKIIDIFIYLFINI